VIREAMNNCGFHNLYAAAPMGLNLCLLWVTSRHFTSVCSTGGYAMLSSRSFKFVATVSVRPQAVIDAPPLARNALNKMSKLSVLFVITGFTSRSIAGTVILVS